MVADRVAGLRRAMETHVAVCRCGRVTVRCEGEPVRVSVCHCLACRKRTGSAFSAQVRFPTGRVTVAGEVAVFERRSDDGNAVAYRFCPGCGATMAYQIADQPDLVAVPLGMFERPAFSTRPAFSVYERRKHAWVGIEGPGIRHED